MTARSMDVEVVAAAVVNLYGGVCSDDVNTTLKWYETLSNSPMFSLPPVENIAKHVKGNYIICSLYQEIWYRNHFAAGSSASPTMEDRLESWNNYCRLLQQLLPHMPYVYLPYQWLWDIVDEFVNQFQSFCEFWALETISQRDFSLLKRRHESWSVFRVLIRLDALIKESKISQILQQENDGGLQLLTAAADDDRQSNMLKVLGYFSMIALSRVHCLLGNYQDGLDCLLRIDISRPGFYSSLIATHVTVIYHYGFASLMLGRYGDAIREFNNYLADIFKTKQNEQTPKKVDLMYALLAICLSLRPPHLQPPIDENVNSQLMEKYGENLSRMQQYDGEDVVALYGELLSYAWPVFSTPFAPNTGDPREFYNEEELAYYKKEDLAYFYPEYFLPSGQSYEPLVNHNQLEVVINRILKLSLK